MAEKKTTRGAAEQAAGEALAALPDGGRNDGLCDEVRSVIVAFGRLDADTQLAYRPGQAPPLPDNRETVPATSKAIHRDPARFLGGEPG
jgi:hypothetical protein